MSMGTWKRRKLQKGQRASRTTGRSKGLVPPTWARACARQARAYKNNNRYEEWCIKCDGSKIKWSSK